MSVNASELLFSSLKEGFEAAPFNGIVQFIVEDIGEQFAIEVTKNELTYSSGRTAQPAAVVTMRAGVIYDLVAKAHLYDSRVLEFSSRLSFTGDKALARFLLNLVMRPSRAIEQQLALARRIAIRHRALEVERLVAPSETAIRCAIEECRPVVISGVLDEWRIPDWNPAVLEAKFGRYQLVSYLPWTIRNYVTAGIPKYTQGVGLPGVLQKYFQAPPILLRAASLGFPLLWLGAPESQQKAITGLHCDCVHGFLCQVFGTKRVILYSPDQDAFVYPFKAFNMYRSCWTGPDALDYEKYPYFRYAKPIETTLAPGEVLFIPLGWFHCIFALDAVMSISYPVPGSYLVAPKSG